MILKEILKKLTPFYKEFSLIQSNVWPISYLNFILRKLKLSNTRLYWIKDKSCWVGMPKRIYVGKNSSVGRANNFFQAFGGIYIGNYVRFATRVSLLTSNHDNYNQYVSHHKPIVIGDYCWLGMNTSILAGVELGPRTIVATGAVVNKSFPEGFCILGGVPAKVIKKLDPNLFNSCDYEKTLENYGYIKSCDFEKNPQMIIDKYLDSNFFEVENGRIVLKK